MKPKYFKCAYVGLYTLYQRNHRRNTFVIQDTHRQLNILKRGPDTLVLPSPQDIYQLFRKES